MTQRDDLFKKFGPMLLEALIRTSVEESNRIRRQIGMGEITPQDVLDQINNHLSELEPYDWMN